MKDEDEFAQKRFIGRTFPGDTYPHFACRCELEICSRHSGLATSSPRKRLLDVQFFGISASSYLVWSLLGGHPKLTSN